MGWDGMGWDKDQGVLGLGDPQRVPACGGMQWVKKGFYFLPAGPRRGGEGWYISALPVPTRPCNCKRRSISATTVQSMCVLMFYAVWFVSMSCVYVLRNVKRLTFNFKCQMFFCCETLPTKQCQNEQTGSTRDSTALL